MSVLTRYIVIEIIKGAFMALLLLWALTSLFTLTDELRDIGKGNYGLADVFTYVGLLAPQYCYELMPFAALLGSLFVMGEMGNNRELVAMRAAGISVMGIIKAVLMAGFILLLISILIGEFIAPAARHDAKILRNEAQHEHLVMRSLYGFWLRDGYKYFNIRQVEENGEIANVFVYELDDDHHLRRVSHIDRATYQSDNKWLMRGIKQSEISLRQMRANEIAQKEWRSSIDPGLLEIAVVNPDNLSILDLMDYIKFLQGNNQKTQKFELALWKRIINPLITLVMLLVSAPFVIGIKKGVSVGARMLLGVLIGLSFNILDGVSGRVGLVYDLNPAIMAVLPSALVLSAALYAISRIR